MAKPGRNDPCPCGSGNKHRKCCLPKEEAAEREQLAKAEARRAESAAAHRFREVKGSVAVSWIEDEAYVKLLLMAREKEANNRPAEEVIAAYVKATAACPTRAEALHGAARYCRNKSLYERGYEFAVQGLAIAYPHNAPAVEDWIYGYGLLDELAVNAYWTERYQECGDACDRLLTEGKMPTEHHDRVRNNKQFATDKLREISARTVPADIERVKSEVGASPVFIVTSALSAEFSAINQGDRFEQTLRAIQSIKGRSTNASILLVDSSPYALDPSVCQTIAEEVSYFGELGKTNPGLNFGFESRAPFRFLSTLKAVSESYAVLHALTICKITQLDRRSNHIFKISGRYWLTDDFDVNDHLAVGCQAKFALKSAFKS